jgi:Lon protease-like protein
MPEQQTPLFPLHTVLFPGGLLPLRVFEPRYMSMLSRCLKDDVGFGVVLIKTGSEIGAAETVDVGTLATVVDWQQGIDGVLGIMAEGGTRFRVRARERQHDGLYVGSVELLEREPELPVPAGHEDLRDLLEELIAKLDGEYQHSVKRFGDAAWVGYRLAEILPVSTAVKQELLETAGASERLELLRSHLRK